MALTLCPASEPDADCMADIHMAAFGHNAMLRAQFPTAALRSELRKSIAQKALADIRDPKKAVLVVKTAMTLSALLHGTFQFSKGRRMWKDHGCSQMGRTLLFWIIRWRRLKRQRRGWLAGSSVIVS